MWTMIAEKGNCYHLAESENDFVSFCGNRNLYINDYVEVINGVVSRIGESGTNFGEVKHLCKKCIKKLNSK